LEVMYTKAKAIIRNSLLHECLSMPREISCGAVVFKKNQEVKYLLLHYEEGHWGFVKGNIEPNESEKDTVIRELEEETGIIEAQFIEGFREKLSYFYRRGGNTIYKEVVFFLIQTRESRVALSSEHVGYKWLSYQKATERLTFNIAKSILKKAHQFLENQDMHAQVERTKKASD